ncbi:polysaccharide deacetylase family protein [Paenibacillus monticola]|uniref:Polysaccharide deacetylase family protein n=1 Tax=Paenibacillus monticola TaxID=2666075 RepID=A0A7X2H5N9_9BACL|nr:polysaccharide deacetylase family protein [Paenibacillus monticola]MRN54044.1 polysaccharide deacetylase family protein [Paenibacillus monticola]
MSSIEPNTILMLELLSLEHKSVGYQLEVGLTRNEGYTKCVLTIDEFTYNQLDQLGPFFGERVRLSIYPKRDPFRQTYYSTLVKINRSFSETMYFACSEDYVSQLLQFKQYDLTHVEEEGEYQAVVPAAAVNLPKNQSAWQGGQIVWRCLMFSFLFFILSLQLDQNLLMESADAQDNSVFGVSSKVISSKPLPLIPSPEPSEPPKEQTQLYYDINIDENKYEYGLPDGYVALSFDDGPSHYTKQIVDILTEHKVAATFLFVGKNVLKHPDEVRYANEHGMLIGNHSWDHSDLVKNSIEENQDNLAKANQALGQIIQTPITIFRPPYGSINDKLANKVKEQHMKVLLWNRDPQDWKAESKEEILQYFQAEDPSGGIYLLHEKSITVKALPEIIEYLKSKNMKFAIFK